MDGAGKYIEPMRTAWLRRWIPTPPSRCAVCGAWPAHALCTACVAGFNQLAFVVLVTFAAVGGVFFGTILLARRLGGIMASPRSSNLMSRITAATVAVTAVWILAA